MNLFTEKEMRYHNMWLNMAYEASLMSHCLRKKVGCVIVKNGRIISTGWNGTPTGFDNCCEDPDTGQSLPHAMHAEANALDKIAKDGGIGADGADMYITLQPCMPCAIRIANSGISRVFYRDKYRLEDGINFLNTAQVQCYQL
jgi:dCMP deaminase